MNTPFMGLRVASIGFGIVAFCHLMRVLTEMKLIVGGYNIPLWMSGLAVVVAGALSAWLWRLAQPLKVPTEHPHTADTEHMSPV
jgi:hypothetical protein